MIVDLQSGRNLVLRAVVGSSKTNSEVAISSSAVSDAGGAGEDKDKAGEELKAITTDTRPSTLLRLLDGTAR